MSPTPGEGGKPEDGVPQTVPLCRTLQGGLVPAVAQAGLSLVTADATQEFSADINKATSAHFVLPLSGGQWDRTCSGTENSITLQGSLAGLQRQGGRRVRNISSFDLTTLT